MTNKTNDRYIMTEETDAAADFPWRGGTPLPVSYFNHNVSWVARDLLGKAMVHFSEDGITAGLVVETEAYLGAHDPACHSARGCTKRNQVMFGPAGRAYIYRIYGIHLCFNVTTDNNEVASAVLLRALEPLCGMDLMFLRRPSPLRRLCRGPACLVQAMGITMDLNGTSVTDGPVRFFDVGRNPDPGEIAAGPRVGISRAADWPLRFYIKGSVFVSRG